MKTIADMSALIKRNEGRMTITFSKGVFTVDFLGYRQTSKHLDIAVEHCVEEMRRAASGVGAMRDGSFTQAQTPANVNPAYLLNSNVATAASPLLVNATCGTQTVQGGTCPMCCRLPYSVSNNRRLQCRNGCIEWPPPANVQFPFESFDHLGRRLYGEYAGGVKWTWTTK